MFTLTVTGCPAVTRQVATTSHSREAATARQLPAPLFAFFQFCFRGYFFIILERRFLVLIWNISFYLHYIKNNIHIYAKKTIEI